MSNQNQISPEMALRYGVRKSRFVPIFVGLLLICAIAGAFYLKGNLAKNPIVSSRLLGFKVESSTQVSVSFEVSRGAKEKTYCVVRAQDENRADVGYATLTFASGPTYFKTTYVLRTESMAVLAEVLNCSNSPVMRVPPPNFPPGVKIPEQLPPGVAPKPN